MSQVESISVETGFKRVASLDELTVGEPRRIEFDGLEICLLRVENGILAFRDSCPHRGHPLSEGRCVDGVLRCALHGWEFSLRDGSAVSPRAPFGLELFDVRVTGNDVEVAP
jgi:nitrite reductase/ring-hydroxylating ferredoxin subunit